MFWGREAEKLKDKLLKNKGICIIGPHPVARGKDMTKFLETPFFTQIDTILAEQKKGRIDWKIPEKAEDGYTIPLERKSTLKIKKKS